MVKGGSGMDLAAAVCAGAKPARAAQAAETEADSTDASGAEAALPSFAMLFAALADALPQDAALSARRGGAAAGQSLATLQQGAELLPQSGKHLPPLPLPAGAALEAEPLDALPTDLLQRAAAALAAQAAPRQSLDAGVGLEAGATRGAALPADLAALAGAGAAMTGTESQRGAPLAAQPSTQPAAYAGPPVSLESGFDQAVGRRVVFMIEHGVQDARVRVHPEHLGPIEIRVKLEGETAQITFHSPHALVRDALTDAVPRLRDLLGDAGLSLSHCDVGSGGDSDSRSASSEAPLAQRDSWAADEADVEHPSAGAAVSLRHGIVDTFA